MKHIVYREDRPAITDLQEKVYSTCDIDDMLHEILEDIFQNTLNLFPIKIVNKIQTLTTLLMRSENIIHIFDPFIDHPITEHST